MKNDIQIKVDYHCPTCNERFQSQQLAISHAAEKKHLVSFSGSIVPK